MIFFLCFYRFEVEVKFSIPTIIVEPTLDVAQNAIADVALAILDANRSMYLNNLCPLEASIFTVIVLLECSVIHYKGLVDEVSKLFSLFNTALMI